MEELTVEDVRKKFPHTVKKFRTLGGKMIITTHSMTAFITRQGSCLFDKYFKESELEEEERRLEKKFN